MKFWELHSICRSKDRAEFLKDELQKPQWEHFLQWHLNFNKLNTMGTRKELDQILPEELCMAVLNKIPQKIYKSENTLRADKLLKPYVEMTFVEIYKNYGGTVLEDIHEKGSYSLG